MIWGEQPVLRWEQCGFSLVAEPGAALALVIHPDGQGWRLWWYDRSRDQWYEAGGTVWYSSLAAAQTAAESLLCEAVLEVL